MSNDILDSYTLDMLVMLTGCGDKTKIPTRVRALVEECYRKFRRLGSGRFNGETLAVLVVLAEPGSIEAAKPAQVDQPQVKVQAIATETDWSQVTIGAAVVAKYAGAERGGTFAGRSREAGKLRVKVDGDNKDFRELPINDVMLRSTEMAGK